MKPRRKRGIADIIIRSVPEKAETEARKSGASVPVRKQLLSVRRRVEPELSQPKPMVVVVPEVLVEVVVEQLHARAQATTSSTTVSRQSVSNCFVTF